MQPINSAPCPQTPPALTLAHMLGSAQGSALNLRAQTQSWAALEAARA